MCKLCLLGFVSVELFLLPSFLPSTKELKSVASSPDALCSISFYGVGRADIVGRWSGRKNLKVKDGKRYDELLLFTTYFAGGGSHLARGSA